MVVDSHPPDAGQQEIHAVASLEFQGSQAMYKDLSNTLSEAIEGGKLPKLDIRCRNLSLSANIQVSGVNQERQLPTLVNDLKLKFAALTASKKQVRKDILKDVTAMFRPGTMTLVLGQPGSGKSSLMKILSGQFPMNRSIDLTGDVLYNGQHQSELQSRLPQMVSYVPQQDEHLPTLSVNETLAFANLLCPPEFSRRPNAVFSKNQLGDKALSALNDLNLRFPQVVVNQLGLQLCQDTNIGDGMQRGVSGGERKRVTIGEMSFGLRLASFMDEISTGLDASATFDIIQTQRHIADQMGATIVISLLQPSPEVFALFDSVLLLNDGELMYHGPADRVTAYFEELGFQCPGGRDIADFLLDIGTPQQVQYQAIPSGRVSDNFDHPKRASEFAELFRASGIFQESLRDLGMPFAPELDEHFNRKFTDAFPTFGRSLIENVWTLTRRQMMIMMRNKAFLKSRAFMVTLMALIFGSLFWQLNPENAQVMIGVAYQASLFLVLSQGAQVPMYVLQRGVFYKQRRANFFQTAAHVVACSTSQLPFAVIEAVYFGTIVYWMCGFAAEAGPYFVFLLILFLNNLAYGAWFFFMSAVAPNIHVVKPLSQITDLFFVVFTGFLIAKNEIPGWFIWIYWINPLTWCLRALAVNQYRSSSMDVCVYNGIDYCSEYGMTMGEYSLSLYDIQSDRSWIWLGIVYMLGTYVLFIGLGYLGLEYCRFESPSAPAVPVDHWIDANEVASDVQESTEDSDDLLTTGFTTATTPKNRIVAIEVASKPPTVTPVVLAFQDLWYTVQKSGGALNETIDLLKGISGYALPGTMTALMGSSGAGKTTLMDVIAGRKTGGTVAGKVMLNGFEATSLAIQRSTGYCEQTDVHSDGSTVREALIFSAFLRQSSAVSNAAKFASVTECLELLDMTSIADQMVRACSAEQLKRLTIGVELAAQPSVLFLDEPTSGLDARTAKIIMDGVRRVADSGRTVLCTIHQPSAEIFALFDSLLLLKRGGETVFFGDLGNDSAKLVQYFEAIPGISPLPKGYNPATWMLECIGAGVDVERKNAMSVDDVDFAGHFKTSNLFAYMTELIGREGIGCESSTSAPMVFDSKRAASSLTQFSVLMKRFILLYWRTPSFNITRFAVSLLLALLFGILYVSVNYDSYQGVNAGLGLIFITSLFNGMIPFNSVMPISSQQRAAFYRERAAQSYNTVWYFMAETLVEIPYALASSLLFTVIFFPMVGFSGFTTGVLYWLNNTLLILSQTYMGQVFVYALPSLEVAMILGVLIISILVLLMGFNPPASAIPAGYKWLYHLAPQKYSMGVFSALVFADCDEDDGSGAQLGCQMLNEAPAGYTGLTVKEYVEQVFLTKHRELALNFGVQIAFIAGFLLLKLLAQRFVNHQKR